MKKTLTEQIVETIIFLGHATINDIYCDIKALKPNVQKGRIEKIIFFFFENGTSEKLKVDGFDDYYEISKGPHNHFICSTCGKVININSQVVTPNNDIDGNIVQNIKIYIYGICSECNKDKKSEIIN